MVDDHQREHRQPGTRHGSPHDDRRPEARHQRRPQHDPDQEDDDPRDQECADGPHVEVVHERLRRIHSMAEQRRQVRDEGADEGERQDPPRQEGSHRTGAHRRVQHHSERVDRQRWNARDEDQADDGRKRVEPREQDERPAVEPEVGHRPQPEATGVADERRGLECATGAGSPPAIAGRCRRHGPERHRHERRSPETLEEPGPAQLRRTHTERDEEHRDDADRRTEHQEPPPAESVRVAREDRREHHLRRRLRGTDETDRNATGTSARQVAQTELHRDADADGADTEEGARDEERADRSRAGSAEFRLAGRFQRAGILPIGHPSRVALRRPHGRNMPGPPPPRTMVRSFVVNDRPIVGRPRPDHRDVAGLAPVPFPTRGNSIGAHRARLPRFPSHRHRDRRPGRAGGCCGRLCGRCMVVCTSQRRPDADDA